MDSSSILKASVATALICLNIATLATANPYDHASTHNDVTSKQFDADTSVSSKFRALQSGECSIAMAAFSNISKSDCMRQFNGFDYSLRNKEAAAAFCTANNSCRALLDSTIKNVNGKCTAEELGSRYMENAEMISSLGYICAQHDGQLCTTTVAAITSIHNTFAVIKRLDVKQLDEFCSPCGTPILQHLADKNGSRSTKGLCTKVGNEYCYPKLVDWNLLTDGEISGKRYEDICDPCFKAMVIATGKTLFGRDGSAVIDKLCNSNAGNGRSCAYEMGEYAAIAENQHEVGEKTCKPINSTGTMCTEDCKSFLGEFVKEAGCCARTFASIDPLDDSKFSFREDYIVSSCKVALPQACPRMSESGTMMNHPIAVITVSLIYAFFSLNI